MIHEGHLIEEQLDELEATGLADTGRTAAEAAAALAGLAAAFEAMTSALTVLCAHFTSPRERRRLRKQAKLARHHQQKLDRIPTWKRVRT